MNCRKSIVNILKSRHSPVETHSGNLHQWDEMERQKELPAYMIVEASMILPMVLCVLIICIYAAFLLYDCCVLYQDAYLVCLRESYRKEEGEPAVNTEVMEKEAEDVIGSRAFAVDSYSGAASADGKWAIYEGTACVAPGFFGSFFLMPRGIWNLSFYARSRKNDPAWSIRSWRRKSYVVTEGLSSLADVLDGS